MLTVSTVSLIEAHPQHRGVVMLATGVRLKILHLSGDYGVRLQIVSRDCNLQNEQVYHHLPKLEPAISNRPRCHISGSVTSEMLQGPHQI